MTRNVAVDVKKRKSRGEINKARESSSSDDSQSYAHKPPGTRPRRRGRSAMAERFMHFFTRDARITTNVRKMARKRHQGIAKSMYNRVRAYFPR